MSSNQALLPELDPLRAVAVSRDVQGFALLIDDMESELGQGWADIGFENAIAFFKEPDARRLEFIVLAIDRKDEARLDIVLEVVRLAATAGLKTILVSDGLATDALDRLLSAGIDDVTSYPFQEGALAGSLARIRNSGGRSDSEMRSRATGDVVEIRSDASPAPTVHARRAQDRDRVQLPATATSSPAAATGEGALFAVQSAAGGDGATTVAVNLAWELANIDKSRSPTVCVIDLGLQFGSVATYLDLQRKPMILEVLSDVPSMDEQAFRQALVAYKDRMHVFTAPADILPLDLVSAEDVKCLLGLARKCFDIVVVDMPATVTGWTDAVFGLCDLYFVICGLEVRSAQNALRFQKLLQAEGLATERLSFVLNRAPGRMDMSGRARVQRMAESLGITFHAVLPDGGRQVTEVNDQAAPLATLAPRNALTRDVRTMARGLQDARIAIASGAETSRSRKSGRRKFLGIAFG